MLLKSDILRAQENSKSAFAAARYLRVSYGTYKRWAKYHGVFDNLKNQGLKGGTKFNHKSTVEKILNGEKTHWSIRVFIQQLIKFGYKRDQCESCGYDRCRIDGKAPYLLHFLDGDRENQRLENLKLLCYNCYYVEVGRELIGVKKRRYWTSDYFSKYDDKEYNKYNEFDFDDFDLDKVDDDQIKVQKDDKEIEELFNKLNND